MSETVSFNHKNYNHGMHCRVRNAKQTDTLKTELPRIGVKMNNVTV